MAAPAGVAAAPQPAPASPAPRRSADKAAEGDFEAQSSAEPMPRAAVEQKMAAPPPPSDLMIADEVGRDRFVTTGPPFLPPVMAPSGNVQIGAPQVSGSLPAEVIRRIAAQTAGRMRLCYERGLRSNPNLAGRVSVRFVIGSNGDVLSAMDGGSSLGDSSTVACVVGVMRSVIFPQPGAGFVTVTLPITFSTTRPPPVIVRTEPSATHRSADDSWRSKGEDVLSRLRAAVEQNPNIRKKHEDLVRGLLARGRFEEALAAAKRFVSLDPDLSVARELLAFAAITNDDTQLAASSLDTQTETDPNSTKWHVRAARSFEALGDERRACAHWRSLIQLSPRSDEFGYEALRCRARILDEQSRVLAEARGMSKPGKWVSQLIAQIETGTPPPFSKSIAGAGQFEAEVTCSSGERCPTVVVVSPRGNVFSPFTPTDSRSGAKSVAFAGIGDGTFMTVLTGGSPDARGDVQLRAFGSTRKFSFGPDASGARHLARGGAQTVAATQITFPVEPPWGRMEGFVLAR
jgi:Ca-activated chloride channel family protein